MKETELLQISNQFRKTLIILIRSSRDLSDRESMIRAVESFIKTFNNMLRS